MAPVIISLSCGPQATNQGNAPQALTVTGTGLAGSTRVRFGTNGPQATPSATTATTATCTVPTGSGVVAVAVYNAGVWSNTLPFYYIPSPYVCGLSPAEGSAAAPPAITITGNHLLTANQATFDATPVTASATTDNAVQAVPAAIAQVGGSPYFQYVDATLRTAGGNATLTGRFVAYDTPTIATSLPTFGIVGTQVTITGTGFVSNSITVTFGGYQAVANTLSETEIVALAPAGPGVLSPVDVVVNTAGGTATKIDAFSYVIG
ncbi:IPT/TIG domain-containing protein [Spirillospora sp. NPDC049024]